MVGPKLAGRKVNLRPLRDDDLDRRAEWLKDRETYELFTGSPPSRAYRRSDAEWWCENLEADTQAVVFAIETKTGRHIGDIDLHAIDQVDKTGKLTVLVGEKSAWDSGFGTDAIGTLLRHAFAELDLEQVKLRVFNFNKRAIRCYQKCGFRKTWDTADDLWLSSGGAETYMAVTKKRFLAYH